jgi:hypothetical protein
MHHLSTFFFLFLISFPSSIIQYICSHFPVHMLVTILLKDLHIILCYIQIILTELISVSFHLLNNLELHLLIEQMFQEAHLLHHHLFILLLILFLYYVFSPVHFLHLRCCYHSHISYPFI